MSRPTDPADYRTSFQSFGQLSRFLREAVTDDESFQLREGMRAVAAHLEGAVAGGLRHADPGVTRQRLAELEGLLREHLQLVQALSPAWSKLYEYGAYLAALHHFIARVQTWQRDVSERSGPAAWFGDFELLSWRTLGEGVMLLDTYEQWGVQDPESIPPPQPDDSVPWSPAKWWRRLMK